MTNSVSQTLPAFTERQESVLKLVALGHSNPEISAKLYITTNTVKVHVRRLFDLTGTNRRSELIAWAYQSGFVDR